LNQSQIFALDLATPSQLTQIEAVAQTVNRQLGQLFEAVGITLIDFKLEFGLDATGALTLGDELSPDNMRLIDQATGQSLDKDVFRQGTGDLRDGYTTVLHRLTTYLGE
jgi:Phosphoribosylaminoimidazolesuccinocarboxamide (SAICAR) synthase